MKMRFKVNIQGVGIDHTVHGDTSEAVVRGLRCALADTVVKKFFLRIRVGDHMPRLDPREEGCWSNREFFENLTDLFNEHASDGEEMQCPASCEQFLELAVEKGMAAVE